MPWDEEDLRTLLEYVSLNPAILFPELTNDEADYVRYKIMQQFNETDDPDNPRLVLNLEDN